MLIAVEVLGFVGKGAQRWLDLGFIRLQPSEFMKPAIVLTLARFYDLLPAGDVRKWRGLWPAAGCSVLVPFGADPRPARPRHRDHGAPWRGDRHVPRRPADVVFPVAPARRRAAAAADPVYAMMHDYQRKRVLIFLDPESDPLGAGYHISQSKIAIGSGGIWGKGYLNGSQSHLDYLPEGHTDFVFATFVEEWGLVGGALLILALRSGHPLGHEGRAERENALFGQLTAAGLTDDHLLLRRRST